MRLGLGLFSVILFAAACDATSPEGEGTPDSGVVETPDSGGGGQADANDATPDAGNTGEPDAGGSSEPTVVPAGDVSGRWSGPVRVEGSIRVPGGQTLEIASGAAVTFAGAYALNVEGTLLLSGSGAMIELAGASWSGVRVAANGTIQGSGLAISGANVCLTGLAGSTIELESSVFTECGTAMRLANGGRFRRVTVIGGNTIAITGGVFDIEDSTIDFRGGARAPDCTDWNGGGARIHHVRFTSCHCPLHFNRTDSPISVTNSIFDDAGNAVMIAGTTGTFTGNHFESAQAEFLDIGGGSSVNVAGNYWGGGAPVIATTNPSQFIGANDYETRPIPGAGPR